MGAALGDVTSPGLNAAADGFGLNTNDDAFGFSLAWPDVTDAFDGVGLVTAMFWLAVSGTGTAGGTFLRKGGISGIFMTIFLGCCWAWTGGLGRFRFGERGFGLASGDLAVAAACFLFSSASLSALAACSSISFCFCSSLVRMGRMSLGMGKGTLNFACHDLNSARTWARSFLAIDCLRAVTRSRSDSTNWRAWSTTAPIGAGAWAALDPPGDVPPFVVACV